MCVCAVWCGVGRGSGIRAYVCATRTATAAKESMLVYLRAMRNRSFCANGSFSGPAMLANVPNACNV